MKDIPPRPDVGRGFPSLLYVFRERTDHMHEKNKKIPSGAEECVEAHAEYLLGKKDSKELMDTLSHLLDEDIKDEVSASDFGDFAIYKNGEISYQTGDQVIPDNYSKKSFASDIKVIDSENPILLYYRLKTDDDNISVWRLILERQSNKTLKISDIHKVTKSEELSFSKVYLPKSDTWVTVS